MDNFLYSLVFFIVALGLLIAIHEFGHYWVAKKLGVKVLRFSIGFGFPLWRRVRGEDKTEYVIAAIPLGGYVKMLDERDPDCPVLPEEQHRAFNRQPVSTRIAVVAAGPLFNFAFAILAYWALFMMGVPGVKPLIGEVQPGSLFAQAGIAHGDLVLSIDDEPMPTLENVRLTLMEGVLDQSVLNVTVQREDMSERELQLDLSSLTADALDEDFMQALGFSPLRPLLPAVLAEVQTSGAAHAAGLQSGDQIIEVDGLVIEDWEAWASYVREHPGQALAVKILRQNQTLDLTVTPATVESPTGPIGRVGAMPDVPEELISEFRAVQRYGVLAAIPVAIEKTWDMSVMTLVMLWKMLVGEASIENISGPLTIATYAGQTAQIGLVAFISFLAIVSVSLGVLNLLPVPVLDGGHLMYYVIEIIKGSPVSEQAQLMGQKIGIIMLGGLMFLALYNDINRLFS